MRTGSVKKYVIPNIPYLFVLWACLKLGTAYRLAAGADFPHKLMGLGQTVGPAFANLAPGLDPFDWLVGIVGAVGFRLLIYFKNKNAKKFRRDEEFGSARWGGPKDIAPFVDPVFENNVILTGTELLTMNTRPKNPANARNLNACVIGSSGSGKTRFWLTPQLLQASAKKKGGCSFVVVDPKGGVLSQVGAFLQRRGYRIKVFNSIDFSQSMHYNPLAYIRNEADILKFVDALISNTKGEGKEGDPFWTKSETLLYCALIAYIIFEGPAEDRNMNTLVDMISGMEVKEDDEDFMNAVDYMFAGLEKRKPDCFAVKQYKKYKLASGKTAKSILVSVGVRLAAFNLPSIAKLTMTDELHLQELGERKIALFCCIPDSDKSLNYLVGMIYTQLIQTLYRQADRVHKGRLPVPVHCLMDEYANISLPKDTFLSALATMRSRAIFCSIIVQNMAQLKAMYKDDWESLVGLCDEFLYLGGTEKETHKYVSELLGKETISTTSYNQSKGRSGSYSINHQQSGRDLMTPDEVRLLDNSKCILFIRGERPVIDLKYNLLKHPNIRYTEDGGAAPYDYTAADNALDDLPGAPENYELLDIDDFLPAEAAEMKPTIQRIRRPK